MFASERRKQIIQLLNKNNAISVNEVAQELDVSKPTIRTDFDFIVETHQNIERTHGGLVLLSSDLRYTKYDDRRSINMLQKQAIADEAFKLIENKTTLLLDSSSTCYELAQRLVESDLQVTVITNGLNTGMLLKENPNLTVILIGGLLKPRSNTTQDEFDSGVFNYFNIDIYFFSASSVSFSSGFTDYNIYEIKSKREYITRSRKTVALIDSSKINDPSNSSFAKLEDVALMITDSNISDEDLKSFKSRIAIQTAQ
ncbi:DeoR/GlpR transcriptional regulator [Erysipelothrix sp. HDW6C]|uniref:DeoR/GlpR family DNA-binding transcription regulator n=1 Tax=Erysipelothrix sp. HDW6C TaxID=2714930 RepID=UPI00140E098F|nr:DeoR/GlpR family DNA-binding transcription regulator [Erysipelothrix sp. HDW6C]QIK70668.1 DeoR/GlpR transcriptional regulator [Erysipelothrix sp. HDW6C]